MKHKTIAVDIAKNVFEIAVSDKPGRVSRRHRPRWELLELLPLLSFMADSSMRRATTLTSSTSMPETS